MRKISTLFLLVILFDLSANSQTKRSSFKEFEIGGEGGLTMDYLTIRDPGDNLRRSHFQESGMGGPKIRQYIDTNFFLEAAFLWKENVFGFVFKQESGTWHTNGSKIFIIPLRVGYHWYVSNKVSVNVLAGIVPTFVTLSIQGSGGYGGITGGNNDIIYYDYSARDEYKKFYLTVQPGISVSHLIKKKFKFAIGVNYYHGFIDVELRDVTYRINNGPVQHAVVANRGSFTCYTAAVTYRFDLRKKI